MDKLHSDATYVQCAICFETYLNARCMWGASVEKRGLLRNHLDSSLEMAMKTHLLSNMPVEGGNSCKEQLEKPVMQGDEILE